MLSTSFTQLPTAKGVEATLQDNEFEAIFDPIVEDDNTFNLAQDQENIPTGYSTWVEDWGADIPKGVWLGPALEPMALDTGFLRTYKRCFIELEQTITFTSNELMNGCSQFWIKYPIVWDPELFLNDLTFNPWVYTILIDNNQIVTTNMLVMGDGLYARVEQLIFPSIDYNFKFRIPLEWWLIEDTPTRGYYNDITPRVLVTGENIGDSLGSAKYKFYTTSIYGEPLPNYDGSLDNIDDISIIELPDQVTLGTTFIFTKGIGQGGLFGRAYPILSNQNTVPITYPDAYTRFSLLTYLSYDTSSDQGKPSILIPFDSIDPVTLLWVDLYIPGSYATGGTMQTFNANIDYSGFFLFTLPTDITIKSISNGWTLPDIGQIPVYLKLSVRNSVSSPGQITFLHNSNPYPDWTFLNIYNYDETISDDIFGIKNGPSEIEDNYIFGYNPVIYAELTVGTWAIQSTDLSTGGFTYSKAFQTKIYVPVHVYEIYRQNKEGGFDRVYVSQDGIEYEEMLAEYGVTGYNDDKGPLDDLGQNFLDGIKYLWNGLKTMYGYIQDGLMAGFEALLKLGEMEVKALLQIRDIIKSIITFMEDNFLSLLELIWLMVGPFLALFMLGSSSKVLKMTIYNKGAKNENN